MVISELVRVARAARVAVEVILPPPYSAYSTLVAVELSLREVIIVEVADCAKVGAEALATALAVLAGLLLMPTPAADDRAHAVPVYPMAL